MRRSGGRLDHLVVTAPVLAEGVAWVETTLGVKMEAGGQHPQMGTHNALLLEARHPHPDRVRGALASIGLSDVIVAATRAGERPRLVAIIDTPDGPRSL